MIAARLEPVASPEPFADDTAGFGYFATDFHYEHLVARLRHHLASTRGFFLVSGAPAPDGELVERAINARREAPHRATLVRCRSGMTLGQVTRAYARQLGLTDESDGTSQWSLLSRLMEDSRKGVIRVLVLERADALDDRAFDELHRFATLDDPHFLPVVLLTQRSFTARLDAPSLQFLQPAIVAHLSLQYLETEEVAAFIRYQLNATDGRHEAVFTRDAIAALAAAAKGDPAEVNRLARRAAGPPARKPPSASPQPAPAAPPPLATAAPKPKPQAEQPKTEHPKAAEPKAQQLNAERPKLEPQIVAAVDPMGPPAPKQAPGPAAAPSTAKRSAAAPAKARAAAAKRNSHKSSAPVASLMVAMLMRARAMAPAATVAAYVVLAAATAGALFYALAPSADREEAEAPQVQTVISSDMPTPAPRVVKPAAPAPLPAIPPAPEIAIAAPPVPPQEPVVAAAPPPPSAVSQQAPEPPPADAAAPTPARTHALAMIEPAAGAKPSDDIVAKVAPAPVPPSTAAKPPGEIVVKVEPAPSLVPPSAAATTPSDVAESEAAPPPAKLPSASGAKTEPASAPIPPRATATPPSQSVAKIEAEPAPVPPRAAGKPSSGATAALVHRGEALLVSGDIVSARQFFARAAETGDAAAACGLAKSYDPLFLQRIGTRGVAGDAAKAVDWYRRAARAGSNEAAARLARLLVKFPQ